MTGQPVYFHPDTPIADQPMPGASTSVAQIATALAKAQGDLSHALKDSENPHFKSKFADLAAVVDVIREPFAKNGLSYLQRTTMRENAVVVTTILMHESGEWIMDDGLVVPVSKIDAQGVGSAITYGRRYTLMAMAGIAPDDDDGNAATASAPRLVQKLTKEQIDTLVDRLVEGGMTRASATAAAKATRPDQYERALAKAQKLVNEQAENIVEESA